jgi:hypothetical protein
MVRMPRPSHRKDTAMLCTNPLTGTPGVAAPATANLGTLYPSAGPEQAVVIDVVVVARQHIGPDARPLADGQDAAPLAMLCTNPLTGTPGVAAPATANLGTLYPSADLKTWSCRTRRGSATGRQARRSSAS